MFVLLFGFNSKLLGAERVALIIANEKYQDSVDVYVDNEAVASLQYELSKKFGFKVIRPKNGSAYHIKRSIKSFKQEAKDAQVSLVYYIGHAIVLSGRPYVIPTNASLRQRSDLKKLIELTKIIDASRQAEGSLVVFDVCWSELLAEGWGDRYGRRRLCKVISETPKKFKGVELQVNTTDSSARSASSQRSGDTSFLKWFEQSLNTAPVSQVSLDFVATGGFMESPIRQQIVTGRYFKTGFQPPRIGPPEVPLSAVNSSSVAVRSQSTLPLQPSPEPSISVTAERRTRAQQPVRASTPASTTGKLFVDTVPSNASVKIMNIQPQYYPGIELRSGSDYRILVESVGFATWERWVKFVPENGQMIVTARLLKEEIQEPVAEPASRLMHDSTQDVFGTEDGYQFELIATEKPESVNLYYRFDGLKFSRVSMQSAGSGTYTARLPTTQRALFVEYFFLATYQDGDRSLAGSANAPLIREFEDNASDLRSLESTELSSQPPIAVEGSRAVAGAILPQDLDVVVERVYLLKRAIEARDLTSLERLTAASNDQGAITELLNRTSSIELDIKDIRSSATEGSISATLIINSYRRSDGSMVVPTPARGRFSLHSKRRSLSGNPDDQWSAIHINSIQP